MQKETYTLIADFSIRASLAFLSHQEILRMFQRALIRAGVPLVYSKGFNPHPYLSIPFPRSVGTCSMGDRLCVTVEYSEDPPLDVLSDAVSKQLPADCHVHNIQCVPGKRLVSPQSARYRLSLKEGVQESLADHLVRCQEQVQKGDAIEIQRYWPKKRRYRTVDIAVYLQSLDVGEAQIEVVCGVSQVGTVRVDELMKWLSVSTEDLRSPVCRTDICWIEN